MAYLFVFTSITKENKMDPKELERMANFMFENNQIGKMRKMIEGVLVGCGYSGFVESMHKNQFQIKFIKKLPPRFIIHITNHARQRTSSYLNKTEELNDEKMKNLLLTGEIVSYGDLLALGYRPNYKGRLEDGDDSVYVKIPNGLVAILSQKDEDSFIWVTTYTEEKTPYGRRNPISEKKFRSLLKKDKKYKTERKRT